MMRKIIFFAFSVGLVISLNVLSARANGSPQWITGEVVSIVQDREAALISLKLPGGEMVSIMSEQSLLKDVQIGDVATVQVIEGRAKLVQIAEKKTPEPTPVPEKKDSAAQWVPGEVVSIQGGETDSLLSIKMSDGTIFNVAASNDKIEGINVGDHVIAKVLAGWAESVSKK